MQPRALQEDRSLSIADAARATEISQGMLGLAVMVLQYAPEFVPDIEAGTKTLMDAYGICAMRQKQEAENKRKAPKPNLKNANFPSA
jgi:hypothetical protein